MFSFNVLFFACDRSVCVKKDGEFLVLDNSGEVVCKWLVENVDEAGRTFTEERDFIAMILFQSSVKKQCLTIQNICEDLIASYSGTTEGLKQVLLQRAQEEKQLMMDCGNRGSAGRLKRVLRELQEEEIAEKRCKDKKAKQSGQDYIRVANHTHAESTASQPGDASSRMNLQKLENLALLAGMASVLHPKSTTKYDGVEREKELVLESPLKAKYKGQKHASLSPPGQLKPKKLFPTQELAVSRSGVTPTRPCKQDPKMMVHFAQHSLTPHGFVANGSHSHTPAYSDFPPAVTPVDVNRTPCQDDPFESNGSCDHNVSRDNEESFHLMTEESPSFNTGEMVYNSLSIINENESFSVGPGSCQGCVRLQAENEHLKAQLQGTCNSELAVQYLQDALSVLTNPRNVTDITASKTCSRSFTVQKTDMQQLVKDSNDPSRFRDVLVPKRKLHKLLEEAKSARDNAGFLLNGISEILFSPNELASAKGVTKARAGTAVLDEEKVDALFEFMKSKYEKEAGNKNLQCQKRIKEISASRIQSRSCWFSLSYLFLLH
ncbi:uncharacterized protein LOC144806568 [Lissotriton helveticus]